MGLAQGGPQRPQTRSDREWPVGVAPGTFLVLSSHTWPVASGSGSAEREHFVTAESGPALGTDRGTATGCAE